MACGVALNPPSGDNRRVEGVPAGGTARATALAGGVVVSSYSGAHMLGRLFPDTIFPRKLNPQAEKRLRLAQARAEEAIIRVHVDSALMFVDTLAEDMPFDRAIETYIRVMGIPEPLAGIVVTRALVVLGEELVPARVRPSAPQPVEEEDGRPALRIDGASEGWGLAVKRA